MTPLDINVHELSQYFNCIVATWLHFGSHMYIYKEKDYPSMNFHSISTLNCMINYKYKIILKTS
jgi:hypothetical protein